VECRARDGAPSTVEWWWTPSPRTRPSRSRSPTSEESASPAGEISAYAQRALRMILS
jgi:hypothetical protein